MDLFIYLFYLHFLQLTIYIEKYSTPIILHYANPYERYKWGNTLKINGNKICAHKIQKFGMLADLPRLLIFLIILIFQSFWLNLLMS